MQELERESRFCSGCEAKHPIGHSVCKVCFRWTCDECGCRWHARQFGAARHWSPVPLIEVI